MRLLLTDRFCASARPGTFFDETATGLSLRVLTNGKTWSFAYTRPDGRRTQCKLGSYPSMSLAAARALAVEARGHLEAGVDPRIAFGQHAAGAMTLAALIGAYLDHPDKLKLRGHAAIKRRLLRNVVPVIGNVTIAELHRRDVQRAIDVIRGDDPVLVADYVLLNGSGPVVNDETLLPERDLADDPHRLARSTRRTRRRRPP